MMIRQTTPISIRMAGSVLALLVVLAPLSFAGVQPGPRVACQVAAFAALVLVATSRRGFDAARPALTPALALVAVALWGTLRAMAWPADPTRAAPQWTAALQWMAVAAALWAATAVGASRRWRRVFLVLVAATALFEVAYGFYQLTFEPRAIWGVEVPGASDRLRGTFIHPDQLAFFLGLSTPMTTAWLWWTGRRVHAGMLGWEHLLLPATLQIFLGVGLVGSDSRVAQLAWLVATAVQLVLMVLRRGLPWPGLPWSMLVVGPGAVLAAWELPETAGMVGLALTVLATWWVWQRAAAVWRDGRRSEDRAAALAVLGALVAAGVQEMVGFGLTAPANAFTLAVLCGLACGAPLHAQRSARAQEPIQGPTARILNLDRSHWRGT